MDLICRVAKSLDTTYHMYDTELQSKIKSTRICASPMGGSEAILCKQSCCIGVQEGFHAEVHHFRQCNSRMLDPYHKATVRGTQSHLLVYITVIWQSFGSTYQAGS